MERGRVSCRPSEKCKGREPGVGSKRDRVKPSGLLGPHGCLPSSTELSGLFVSPTHMHSESCRCLDVCSAPNDMDSDSGTSAHLTSPLV